jgi:hypothetical protein
MRKRDAYLDLDDDEQVEDGRTVRTPMMLMDGRDGRVFISDTVRYENGQPHFLRATDEAVRDARAAARDARDEMIRRAEDAWRTPLDARARRRMTTTMMSRTMIAAASGAPMRATPAQSQMLHTKRCARGSETPGGRRRAILLNRTWAHGRKT